MAVPKLRFKDFDGEWKQKKLADFVKFYSGLTYSPDDVVNSGGTLVLRSSNIQSGSIVSADNVYVKSDVINSENVLKGDIIVVVRNGSRSLIGKHAQVTKDMPDTVIGAFMTGIRADEPGFLNVLLDTTQFQKEIYKNLGATINQITTGAFKEMSFVVSESMEEQKKIGSFFSTLDKKIQLQQEKIDLLKEQKKAYQLKLFNTEGWMGIRLGDYADIKGRLGWKGLKQEEYVENGPYLIAGKHIVRGQIQWDKCDMITNERYEESMEIALEKEDIIFSKDGSLGNPAYISNLPDKATINSTMMLVRVQRKEELDSNFVYHILNSHIFKKLIHLKVSGSSIPHLFQADMKEFSFAIPNDINEQKQIANFFNLIDRKISLAYEKLDSLKLLKQGFMQQMFI